MTVLRLLKADSAVAVAAAAAQAMGMAEAHMVQAARYEAAATAPALLRLGAGADLWKLERQAGRIVTNTGGAASVGGGDQADATQHSM